MPLSSPWLELSVPAKVSWDGWVLQMLSLLPLVMVSLMVLPPLPPPPGSSSTPGRGPCRWRWTRSTGVERGGEGGFVHIEVVRHFSGLAVVWVAGRGAAPTTSSVEV